jgi:peroxiredoxin
VRTSARPRREEKPTGARRTEGRRARKAGADEPERHSRAGPPVGPAGTLSDVDRRRLLVGSLAVALVVGVAGGWFLGRGDASNHLTSSGAGTLPNTGIPVATDVNGKPLPDVSARSLDGSVVTLRSLIGGPLVVNFWASTCIPCRKEMPDLQAVHDTVGDRVRIVGVNPQDTPEGAKAFAKKYGVTYELLRDPDGAVTTGLGVAGLPTTFFVSADGTILKTKTGAFKGDELSNTIAELYPT